MGLFFAHSAQREWLPPTIRGVEEGALRWPPGAAGTTGETRFSNDRSAEARRRVNDSYPASWCAATAESDASAAEKLSVDTHTFTQVRNDGRWQSTLNARVSCCAEDHSLSCCGTSIVWAGRLVKARSIDPSLTCGDEDAGVSDAELARGQSSQLQILSQKCCIQCPPSEIPGATREALIAVVAA